MTSGPVHPHGPPPPQPSASSGTGKPWIVPLLLLLIPGTVWGWDLEQSLTHSGIYRPEYAGEILSARPTAKALVDWALSGRNRYGRSYTSWSYQDGYNAGRYVVKIRDEDGHTFDVSVSKRQYYTTLIPGYAVGKRGELTEYKSREAAEAAGAIPKEPGPP